MFIWLLGVQVSPCTRKGMYKVPIMVYLDSDSIEAIAADHDGSVLVPEANDNSEEMLKRPNYKINNEKPKGSLNSLGNAAPAKTSEVNGTSNHNTALKKDGMAPHAIEDNMMSLPILDSKSIAEQFIGSIFNEVNTVLFPLSIQLQMIMQQPLDGNIDCTVRNPLYFYLKYLETKHKDSTPFSKMFVIYCDNYGTFLDLSRGIYHSQKGKDFCTNHLGFLYVNNDILREKIKRGLFSIISQSKITNGLSKMFYTKTCNYLHRCIDNSLIPVGSVVDFLRPIVHKGPQHLSYDMVPPEKHAAPYEPLLDAIGDDLTVGNSDWPYDMYDFDKKDVINTHDDNGYTNDYGVKSVYTYGSTDPTNSFM